MHPSLPFARVVLLISAATVSAFEVNAVVRGVDAENRSIVVFAGGQDRKLEVATDATFTDSKGVPLADGLKSKGLKDGAEVTLTVERGNGRPALLSLKLNHNAEGSKPGAPRRGAPQGGRGGVDPKFNNRPTTGLKPLDEMTAEDRYQGEDGGLYGGGKNEPPAAHAAAAKKATKQIVPRDAAGTPSSNGKIGVVSISMSNATQEYSKFKQIADADPQKSSNVAIVDCAQGGQAMAEWVDPRARAWQTADQRLASAGVSPEQVQVVWIKLANKGPSGTLENHGRTLERDTLAIIHNAKQRFPNLQIAYLGSRIYGGYTQSGLNPEPQAYEGAFVVRWMIQDQAKGNPELNYDADRGAMRAPVLLWGPYFWADGTTPRKSDGLVYDRSDLAGDGTHPSESGRQKVAELMLRFFTTDADAKRWFVKH